MASSAKRRINQGAATTLATTAARGITVAGAWLMLPLRYAQGQHENETCMPYLTDDPIDTAALVRKAVRPSDGAYVVFEGIVRNHHEGHAVESIFYDAYRP